MHPDVVHATVNTEAEQQLAANIAIRSIPTICYSPRGHVLDASR